MKGKRTDMRDVNCGIARALQVVGDWWSLLIVREAFKGRRRFSEFQRTLGLARNILSVRLRKLVDEGIFSVEPDPDSALSHLYLLTPKGRQLSVILVALWQWGEDHCFAPGELDHAMVDSLNGQPLQKLRLKAQDGRLLGPGELRIAARENGLD